jgi:hypothetical protein
LHILAAAQALQIDIHSVYPYQTKSDINDFYNTIFKFIGEKGKKKSQGTIHILWINTNDLPGCKTQWKPNHFVSLIPDVKDSKIGKRNLF